MKPSARESDFARVEGVAQSGLLPITKVHVLFRAVGDRPVVRGTSYPIQSGEVAFLVNQPRSSRPTCPSFATTEKHNYQK